MIPSRNKAAYLGVFLALALICSYVESLIPFYFGIPGVKLGLTNLVVVMMLYCVGTKEALAVSVCRIVLAGFLVVIPPEMIAGYRNKIINVHPSLIPSFCGTGYYGLKVHEAALDRGVKVVGATVHFVDEGTDTGPIILQRAVEVQPEDTPEILQKRVMEQAEWKILPKAIDLIAHGRVHVTDGRAVVEE